MSFVGQLFKYIAAKKLMNDQSIISAIIDAENNKERIRKEIENNTDLMKTIKDGDKMIADLQKTVKYMQEKGYPIPSYAKKYLK